MKLKYLLFFHQQPFMYSNLIQIFKNIIWRHPNQSELILIVSNMELTHLDLDSK